MISSAQLTALHTICAWIVKAINDGDLCPVHGETALNNENNICPYITSHGECTTVAADGDRCVLRVPVDKTPRSISQRVASKITQVYGKDLFQYCHMGKEEPVYMHALNTCMTTFRPDFRLLLGCDSMYDTGKHLTTLNCKNIPPGLRNASSCVQGDDECPVYVRPATWLSSCTGAVSESLGVNIWGLLAMASLLGTSDLHPKGSCEFARRTLALILRHAPASATPGNMIPIRSFDVDSGKPQYLQISASVTRPEHFLRPKTDENFAQVGDLTYCRDKDGFLPEDMMHCANVVGTAMFLKCKVKEVTPDVLRGNYQLMPKRRYPLARLPDTSQAGGAGGVSDPMEVDGGDRGLCGWIYVCDGKVFIHTWRLGEDGNDVSITCGCADWEDTLRATGCIILPMVCRPCAAVWMDDTDSSGSPTGCGRQAVKRIGVVVPATAAEVLDDAKEVKVILNCVNFNPTGWNYLVSHEAGVEPTSVSPVDMLERLVPIGTPVWIKPHTVTWGRLANKIPADMARRGLPIRARVNVPPEASPEDVRKVYVSCVTKASAGSETLSAVTMAVDPWDLESAGPEDMVDGPVTAVAELFP